MSATPCITAPALDRCTVRIRVALLPPTQTLTLFDRKLATRATRNHRVQLGRGVTLVQGGFHRQGGSVMEPKLDPLQTCQLEVRDVPLAMAVKAASKHPDAISVAELTGCHVEPPDGGRVRQSHGVQRVT